MDCARELKLFKKCVFGVLKDTDTIANRCAGYQNTQPCKLAVSILHDNYKQCYYLEQLYKDCLTGTAKEKV